MKSPHFDINPELALKFRLGLIAIDYSDIRDSCLLLTIFRNAIPNESIHWSSDKNYFFFYKGINCIIGSLEPPKYKELKTINDFLK